jgi:WD40 repeat protein
MPKINVRAAAGILILACFGAAIVLWGAPRPESPEVRQAAPRGIVLGLHQYAVRCLAFASNGQLLASGGGFGDATGEIKVWDLATRSERATLRGDQTGVYALAFSPNGRLLATASLDHLVRLWDVATGQELASTLASLRSSTATALAPDGRTFALAGLPGDCGRVRLWRVDSEWDQSLTAGSGPFAFSMDSRCLVLWRLAEKPPMMGSDSASSEGSFSASRVGEPPRVQSWDVPIGGEMSSLRGDRNFVWALAFSPDGRTLASAGFDGTVRLWDIANGQLRTTFWGHTDQVDTLAFAPDGQLLASGSHDGTVRLWDTATGEELATLHGHTGRVTAVAFAPNGQWIASGSHDRTVRLWPLAGIR